MKKSQPKKEVIEEVVLPEHYDSIDYLPVLNWDKVHKTANMVHLLKTPIKLSVPQSKELSKVWENIYKEYFEVFGLGSGIKEIAEVKLKIAKLKLKEIITGDVSIRNFIRQNEILLKSMEDKQGGESDIYETKKAIEIKFNMHIPIAVCSVREFYSYLKDLK